jgi:hypothetical protein
VSNNKLIWITTSFVLFLLFVIPAVMASLIKMIPDGDQPGYGNAGRVSVYGLRTFTQEFISQKDNLIAIGTTIKNPNLKNKKDIIFNLYNDNNIVVRTTKLNGFNIGDGDFVKIVFDVIPDSKDKKYHFTISSPEANEEEIVELFLVKPTSTILNYSYNEKTYEGGIPMVAFHKPESVIKNIETVFFNLSSKL